jgi:pSer/pThr/pTyr-binding forkhead associated (FHA) protein
VLILGAVGLVLAALWFMTSRRRTHPTPVGQITQAVPGAAAPLPAPTTRPQAGVAYLTANTPGQSPAIHPINKKKITLGRDPGCEIQVDGAHATVSRRHAQIVHQGEEYILVDLNSASGVYLDNVRVGRNRLRDGVVFSLGRAVSFTFHLNPGA